MPDPHSGKVFMPLLAFEVSQWLIGLMVVFFLFVSLCMMLIVLIQRPQGGGIAGAFGGGGSEGAGQTAFGAKTGDVLTTVTIGIFVVFIGSAIALNYLVRPPKAIDETTVTAPAGNSATPPATTTPAAPATATNTEPAKPGAQPDADGKFRLETPGGSIESVVPVEIIPGGQQPAAPAGTEPAPAPAAGTPAGTAPAPAPAPAPGTTPPPAQNPTPTTPPAGEPKPQ